MYRKPAKLVECPLSADRVWETSLWTSSRMTKTLEEVTAHG